jgi:hypothetical protein
MLAEAVHSVADTSNQGLLLWVSGKRARIPIRRMSAGTGAAGDPLFTKDASMSRQKTKMHL